ncbi:MAG: hypothetical protein H0X26_03355 [Alphaproteobacteria bacterium]|nr:hypothetical protein [Alphaproteobacteria bacterium]
MFTATVLTCACLRATPRRCVLTFAPREGAPPLDTRWGRLRVTEDPLAFRTVGLPPFFDVPAVWRETRDELERLASTTDEKAKQKRKITASFLLRRRSFRLGAIP